MPLIVGLDRSGTPDPREPKTSHQMMTVTAAVDWSGSPDAPEAGGALELYIPCAVRVASVDRVNEQFRAWREAFGFAADYELHGYRLRRRSDILVTVVEYVRDNAQVVAYLFDKREMMRDLGSQVFDKPGLLAPATGLLVCHRMLEKGPLRQIFLDEDIAPRHRPEFNTEIKRKARTLWPEQGIAKSFPKHHPSDKHNVIQLADMIAYLLQREAHGLSETAQLRRSVKALWQKEGNDIRTGGRADLQPYL